MIANALGMIAALDLGQPFSCRDGGAIAQGANSFYLI